MVLAADSKTIAEMGQGRAHTFISVHCQNKALPQYARAQLEADWVQGERKGVRKGQMLGGEKKGRVKKLERTFPGLQLSTKVALCRDAYC